MKLLTLFIILNIANVIIQTVKSICTIKCGKGVAAIVNAIAYGLYTVVIVYTNCELNLWAKVLVVALTNLIGVYVVKFFEEKMRKDKLWKIEVTVPTKHTEVITNKTKAVPHNYLRIDDNYTTFNFYCSNKNESKIVKNILNKYDAKYFVTESKIL